MPKTPIFGIDLRPIAGCTHYHTPLDIIGIQFKCCNKIYACFECHTALEPHSAERWPTEAFATKAILCRNCDYRMSIHDYMLAESRCPRCSSAFNPGCKKHWSLYFEIPE